MRTALARIFYVTGEGNRLTPEGVIDASLKVGAVGLSVYIGWYAFYGITNEHFHGAVFLLVMLPVIFLTTTASRAVQRLTVFDYGLAAASVAVSVYYVANDHFYQTLIEGVTPIPGYEIAVGIVTVVLSVEACRRSVGWGLTGVVAVLFAYVFFGHFLVGELHHDPIRIDYFVQLQTVLSVDGIFGTPLQVAATYAFLFVLFGSFYQRAGGGQFFYEIAIAVCGRAVGGPAKACVVSSGLYGSISGSPTADVVTTGPITIPLMVRTGISPQRAAAIEAASSSGGALLPPVMGTVAFLMVGFTGLSYDAIIKAGALVALLYYFGVFMAVHAEAKRGGQSRIDESEIVGLIAALRRGWRQLLPIVVLLYLLVKGYTPTYVAAGSTLFVVLLSWLNRDPKTRIGPRGFVDACMETVFRMSALTGAVLAAGAIIGAVEMTGMPGKFSLMVNYVSAGNIVLVLVATAFVVILLGMGTPATSSYIMGVALLAPVLMVNFKVPLLQTHMFLLYFSCMSAITPPLATACFAAAAIADVNPISIANYAVKVGFAGFVLPFFFIFNPGLLLVGSVGDVVAAFAVGTSLILAALTGIHGWIGGTRLVLPARLAFAAVAVAMIYPLLWLQLLMASAVAASYVAISRSPQFGRVLRLKRNDA